MFKDLVKWQWNLEGWERYGQTDDGDLIIMLIGLNVEVKGDSTISGGDFFCCCLDAEPRIAPLGILTFRTGSGCSR